MGHCVYIYYIKSKSKDRGYIGSSIDAYDRISQHKTSLRNNNHVNKKLQNHVNKYGLSDLEFSIIGKYPVEYRPKIEQFYINNKFYNSYFNCDLSIKDCKIVKRKLLPQDCRDIFKIFEEGKEYRIQDIANKYNVSDSIIYNLRKRFKRGILIEEYSDFKKIEYIKTEYKSESYSKLTEKEVLEIIDIMNKRELHSRKVCEKYKISMSTYQKIKIGRTWKHLNYLIQENVKNEKFRKTPSLIKNKLIIEFLSLKNLKFLNRVNYLANSYNVSSSQVRIILHEVNITPINYLDHELERFI